MQGSIHEDFMHHPLQHWIGIDYQIPAATDNRQMGDVRRDRHPVHQIPPDMLPGRGGCDPRSS